MPFITYHKNWLPLIIILLVYLIFQDYRKALVFILMAVVAISLGDFFTHHLVKPFFARARPCNALEGVRLLSGCTKSFSLPSSHAVNVFALGSVVVYEYKKLIILMAVIGVLVAYSRVYVGVHYPFDVLMGALNGILYGIVVISIKKEMEKKWLKKNQQ